MAIEFSQNNTIQEEAIAVRMAASIARIATIRKQILLNKISF